ncbi:hypothetical protein [uncultured Alistipes sp.]|uniref:hypothetical protein n=1 Tax=uncultured Alistipes sp. TaxID=538949 RepID=UPI0025E638F2|nr:hypothetical protein [uncultured Alistipes sp.]
MKKFNDTVIIVLTIASTIVGYLTWGLMALIVLLIPHIDNTNFIILFTVFYYILILFVLLWGCRKLYRQYNCAETQRAVRWRQALFIFLMSFSIKYFLNGIMLITTIGALFIPYGMDIIFIIPIAVFVNLKIAHRKLQKTNREEVKG